MPPDGKLRRSRKRKPVKIQIFPTLWQSRISTVNALSRAYKMALDAKENYQTKSFCADSAFFSATTEAGTSVNVLPSEYLKMTLRIGTDCSGIEAPLQAAQSLGLTFKSCFCSDVVPRLVNFSKRNFGTWKDYDDVVTRHNKSSSVPNVDIYAAGFPCQPFSSAGNRWGKKDPRGQVLPAILDYIITKSPKIFFLRMLKASRPLTRERTVLS